MARQSMSGALLRNHTSIAKFENRRHSSSTKSLERDIPRILVDETSFLVLEYSTKCAYVTYLTFGPDGQWTRILSLPAECVDKFKGLVDMDGLCVVSPAPIIPFSVKHPRYLRSIWHTYSGNPVGEAKLSGIVRHRGSQPKALANKSDKPNASPCSCAVWSDIMPGVTDTACLSENCKVPKRKSKKKAKKKKRQSKKLHSDTAQVEAEALSAPHSNCLSTAESFADYDMELDGSVPNPADFVDSSLGIYDTQAVRRDLVSHFDKLNPAYVMDTELDMSYQSSSKAFDTEEYVHIGGVTDTLSQQINWFECDTESANGNHDSIVSDSGFTGLNSIDSGDTICDVTNNGLFISSETSPFVGNSASSESSSIWSVEFGTRRKGRKIGSKECSSGDVRMYTQKANNMNSMPGRCANKRTAHGHFGKENLHSVWKKVQKTHSNSVYSVENNNNMISDFCVTTREKPHRERYCHFPPKLSAADDLNNLQVNTLRKPTNRISPESQLKGNFPSRKEYHPKKGRSSTLLKVNRENDRSFNDASQKKMKQARGSNSRYHTLSNSSRIELHNNKVDVSTRASVPGIKVYPQDTLVSEMTLTTKGKIDTQKLEGKYSLPTEPDASSDLSNCIDQIQPGQPALKEDEKRLGKEASSSTNGKKDYNSGFVLQKWIPVGRKVPCPTGLERSDTSLLLHFDKPEAVKECSKITKGFSCDSISTVASDVQDPSPIFEILHDSEKDTSESNNLKSETIVMSDSERNIGILVGGVKEVQISSSDVFLKKTTFSVEETYRVQMESAVVQAAIGTAIAGFENFLQSACPVILKVETAFKCQLCHREPTSNSFLCTHELQNVSLGSLWKWYERHSSYGLEVREERFDDPSKFGHREFGLRTYFVPYLSAVQLFRNCRNGYVNGSPCTDTISHPLPDQSHSLQPCCEPITNNATAQSAGSTGSYELVFEYFETEQPRRRQPLFDKIKELAEGEGSQHQVYGDPRMLSSSDICDLHPRSWYSVAWYPIYKIPDGNFRAAFLTYHSLGHLVHRRPSSNSSQLEIVSPIVGLLSCNAQCEGWFQPIDRESSQKPSNTTKSSLSETIHQRLQTLEHTATLLATSTVNKGNITSINRHPDYNFFTSRRR